MKKESCIIRVFSKYDLIDKTIHPVYFEGRFLVNL